MMSSCHDYSPSDDYTFTGGVSIMRTDSITHSVTVNNKSYLIKNLNTKLNTYAIDGTEFSNTNEVDTCLQLWVIQKQYSES